MSDYERKGRRQLSPDEVDRTISELADIARSEGVASALIGGAALQVYGSDRMTADVDVAVERLLDGLPRGQALSFGGEATKLGRVPVDVVVRDDKWRRLYADVIDGAVRVRGVALRVASPEHLVAMKMVAGRPRDEVDLGFLLASGEVDLARARRIVEEFLGPFAVDELDRFADEAVWRKDRGRL